MVKRTLLPSSASIMPTCGVPAPWTLRGDLPCGRRGHHGLRACRPAPENREHMGHPADSSERFRPEGCPAALGVDVGADGITAVVADDLGRVIRSLERPVRKDCRSDEGRLVEEISAVVASLGTEVQASVVGVCVPGVVDEAQGRICHSADLGLQDLPLGNLVSQALEAGPAGSVMGAEPVEVALFQDVRCGAWAESRWGAGGASCLYLSVGAGISAAVLLDGVPVHGGGWAGQAGRIMVPDPDWSGERARLEDVASLDAMVGRYTAGLVDDVDDSDGGSDDLGGCGGSDDPCGGRAGSPVSGFEALLGAMRSGDREARRVWDTGLDALADLIACGAGLLGPLDVVVSSDLTRAGEVVFLEPLRLRVAGLMAGLPAPALLTARLGKPSRALGAAGRALENWH